MQKVYSPTAKTVTKYGMGEIIDVKINSMAIIPILADKIYKSPMSAIRELYANEVTAVKKTLRLNNTLSPEIIISINSNTREMSIKGVDSLGISIETFRKILTVMGNSGNNSGEETGYFGLGFFSFVKLSERAVINSYSLESGEKWAAVAKSALQFEMLPPSAFTPLDKTGFEITLSIKNNVDILDIIGKVEEISLLSGVKTSLIIDGDDQNIAQYDNLKTYFNHIYAEYAEDGSQSGYSMVSKHIETDDYEIILCKSAGKAAPPREDRFYLINVPIQMDLSVHGVTVFLNIKNERLFKPSADRERISDEDEQKLADIINDNEIELDLSPINTLDELYASNMRFFYVTIHEHTYLYVKDGTKKTYANRFETERLLENLPIEKPKEFRISKSVAVKAFQKLKNQGIYAVACEDKAGYEYFLEIGFTPITKRKTSTKSGKPRKRVVTNFKFWSRHGSVDKVPLDSIVCRVENTQESIFSDSLSNKIYWISKNANYDNTYDVERLKSQIDMDHIYTTSHGFKTAKQIIAYINHSSSPYINVMRLPNFRNNIPWLQGFISKKEPCNIILDDNKQSAILEAYLKLGKKSVYRNGFNIGNNRRKTLAKIITDTRLKIILDSTEYNSDFNSDIAEPLYKLQLDINRVNHILKT